jgi:hypothetical protein
MVNYHLEYAMLPPIRQRLKSILAKEKIEKHTIIETQLKDLIAEDSLNVSTQLLSELSGDANIADNEHLKCLYTIDGLNHTKIKALIAKRLKVKLYNKNVGDAIDSLVYPYCRRLYLSYLHAAEQQFEQGTTHLLKHDELVFLLCRAINAAFTMLMWRYFDDQPAPVDTWKQVNKLFRYAENSTLLNDRIVLFQQEDKVTDFSSLYVAGLMLSTMQKGNYSASEIHIVSTILFTWAQGAMLDKAYQPNKYQFAVDLDLDKGAERIRKFDPKADYRFWRTEYIVDKVDVFLKAVTTNTLPKDSEMRGFGSVRVLIKLFKKLQQDWSADHYKRQRRGSTRIKTESQLHVINGLEQVYQQLTHHVKQQVSGGLSNYDVRESTYSKMLDSHTRSMILGVDEWVVVDESVTGFGVDLGKNPSAWIDVGKLIGCKHTVTNNQYFVAEIKSVKKQKNGAYRAGVKLISTQCIPLHLYRLDQSEAELSKGFYLDNEHNDVDMNKFSCLWVPAKKGAENSKPTLIIPFGEYQRDRQFKMDLGGEEKTLMLGKAIDIQAEWVRAVIASVH